MTKFINSYNKTRIAPTPSGFLHLGNVLSFAITAALAQETGAKILLRIDDMDQQRANPLYVKDIFDTLSFLSIPWHQGPRNVVDFHQGYSQPRRMELYQAALKKLVASGKVYACTCSRQQLNQNAENPLSPCPCFENKIQLETDNVNWRLITGNQPIAVKDNSGEIIHQALPPEMQNFIVRKKDGFPAYQLTSVIDDLFYGVDFIVRGQDLWPSTLAQHQLAMALGENGFADITFYHHPLLTEPGGKKLSKSAGATSVRYLRENGNSPEAIYTAAAAMMGFTERIANWQELAALIKID